MTAKIISGTEIAREIRKQVAAEVRELKENGITPGLVCILVGDDPASISYVAGKSRACEEVGIHQETIKLPSESTQEELIKLILKYNRDIGFHGILVQLPLPGHIDETKVSEAILPDKDIDGFHPVNVGKLLLGKPTFLPCTPYGVQQLLLRSGYDPGGKHIVICGRSTLVGKPLAAILMQKKQGANATVTVCHTATPNISFFTRQADILVTAMGQPRVITADMIKRGAVVIDVGISRIEDPTAKSGYRLVGDVDFDDVKKKAGAITPVPGGVGPMTVTMLLANTLESARRAANLKLKRDINVVQ